MSTVSDGGNGRGERGRFAPGNKLGNGNPLAKRMNELRKALVDSVAPDDVVRVGKKLREQAEDGDVVAARLLLEYAVGRPAQAIELTGADGAPLGVEFTQLQATLLNALRNNPDGRVAVALALRTLANDARDVERPGDGAGPESDPDRPGDGG
jgi:hypothetical protein